MTRPRRIASVVTTLALVAVLAPDARGQEGAQAPAGGRALAGTIVDVAGAPVAYAYVQEEGGARYVVTDKDGRFRIARIEAGRHAFTARRLGYYPIRFDADLAGDSTVSVTVTMAPHAKVLQEVWVEAERPANYSESLDRRGFYRRLHDRTLGAGTGHFIMPEELEQRNPTRLTQMLNALPGVSVQMIGGSQDRAGQGGVPMGRGSNCTLGLVLDGQRVDYAGGSSARTMRIVSMGTTRATSPTASMGGLTARTGQTFDQLINPADVKAMEVYPSAVGVPVEFAGLTRGCGLVVVWTKRRDG